MKKDHVQDCGVSIVLLHAVNICLGVIRQALFEKVSLTLE